MTDPMPPTEATRSASSSRPVVKQVRLNLVYIDLWSAVKVSSLVSTAVAISVFLSVILTWLLLNTVGVIGALEGVIGDILGEGGGALLALLDFGQVALLGFVGALINLVSLTVLGSLGALLYNLIARMTGGLSVGFTNT
ncbi:MAG: DUF3566 domain-containing protein [Microbacteriaceae bacterium]|mgnify:FL=1|jgi:hypothetical protein|nr:DUF3566 domain-containing protein [Pontimonas sp.]MBT5247657.1 DUF3566 domain-containing protein [Microbacteriaceae bacterium]MBT5617416.1 DUF3566 domain-containing protein [Microbacteriaceae bacterium]MBT5730997.1 DUF3566 domain-containing protein [Microbacteriaceae bacterium]MDA9114453.1 DUF3566 domain-containing protein [Pontimonas sp.]